MTWRKGVLLPAPLHGIPTLQSLCRVVTSLQILKHLYRFFEVILKTMNMALLQPAEIGVPFLKRVQNGIKRSELFHAGGMLLLSVPGVLRKSLEQTLNTERGQIEICSFHKSDPAQNPVGLHMAGPTRCCICFLGWKNPTNGDVLNLPLCVRFGGRNGYSSEWTRWLSFKFTATICSWAL